MTRLVLGSASTGRLRVLRLAGADPLVIVSGVDEDAIIAAHAGAPPYDVVCALAAAKAGDVVRAVPAEIGADCVVVGCDSMLYLDGELRGKPGTVAAAREQWQSMAGRAGVLYTGHCAIRLLDNVTTREESEVGRTTVHFGMPADEELEAYLSSGEPLGVAGAFTLDGLGGWFVDGIDGDPSNVIGLSLPVVRRMLTRCGLSVADIWRTRPSAS